MCLQLSVAIMIQITVVDSHLHDFNLTNMRVVPDVIFCSSLLTSIKVLRVAVVFNFMQVS